VKAQGCYDLCRQVNQAFQLSAVKGWSKADRLNSLLKQLFFLCLRHECVLRFVWISTHDNILADFLSRKDGEAKFLQHPLLAELLAAHGGVPRRNPACSSTRRLTKQFSERVDGDGPKSARVPFQLTVSYARCSIYAGVPTEALARRLDQVLDNRLGESSHRSVHAALAHWDVVRARHAWGRIMFTDDAERGAKLATFVLYLVDSTELVYSSISNYVWALRSWMKFQRQADPVYGVIEWGDVMQSVEVLTFMPSESRKEVPGSWVAGAVAAADPLVFEEVRAVLIMLMLLFTFARSESPVPKNLTGPGAFNSEKQLCSCDVRVATVAGKQTVQFRLKGIKQDTLGQRATAQGDGDWVIVGSTGDQYDIVLWLRRYFSFFSEARSPKDPFFVFSPRETRPWLYQGALDACRELWARTPGVTSEMAATCGLHGLRVGGNGGVTRVLGRWLAKAQGGWDSDSQDRYDRVDMQEVVQIPGAIVSSWTARETEFDFGGVVPTATHPHVAPRVRPAGEPLAAAEPPRPAERVVDRSGTARAIRVARVTQGTRPASTLPRVPPASASQCPSLPVGWLVATTGTKRKYKAYYSPDGERYNSLTAAARAAGGQRHRAPARLDTSAHSVPSSSEHVLLAAPTVRNQVAAAAGNDNLGVQASTVSGRLVRQHRAPALFVAEPSQRGVPLLN
jgi:hypothetical protein